MASRLWPCVAKLLQLIAIVPRGLLVVAGGSLSCRCLVCAACPVSVSVRPARLSVSEAARDSGHHSRFVQKFLLLATAAPVLASMSGFLLEPIHRGELFHPALGRSRRGRGRSESPLGGGRWHGSHCAIRKTMGQGAHHSASGAHHGAARTRPARIWRYCFSVGAISRYCFDKYLQPFGRRVAGDESGLALVLNEYGRCDYGHQPG